jgi:hypothetical protein
VSYIVEAVENECCNNAAKGKVVIDTRGKGLLFKHRHGRQCISLVVKQKGESRNDVLIDDPEQTTYSLCNIDVKRNRTYNSDLFIRSEVPWSKPSSRPMYPTSHSSSWTLSSVHSCGFSSSQPHHPPIIFCPTVQSKKAVLSDRTTDIARCARTAVESHAESHQKHNPSHRDRVHFCCTSHGQFAPGPLLRASVWVKYQPIKREEFVTTLQPIT